MFTHDSIKALMVTVRQHSTNVQLAFLFGVRLWQNALFLTVYKQEMFKRQFFINFGQTNWTKKHFDDDN